MSNSEYRGDWHRSLIDDDIIDSEQIFTLNSSRHKSLSRNVVELVVNMCEELNFSPAVEFTCLDTFDTYVASFYQQTIRRYSDILFKSSNLFETTRISATTSTESGNIKQKADEWMVLKVETFERTLVIRLIAVLMLSAKLIGNNTVKPTQLSVFVGLLSLISNLSDSKALKETEFEVFQVLNFSIKPSISYYALELFVSLSDDLPDGLQFSSEQMVQLEMSSVQLLRVAYISREQIQQQYRETFGQLEWEATIALMGSRLTIWFSAAIVIFASIMGCKSCTDWQRNALKDVVLAEAGLPERSVCQLVRCLREMYDIEHNI